jgi:hypothetical protein
MPLITHADGFAHSTSSEIVLACPECQTAARRMRHIRKFENALIEFGYDTVTTEEVTAAYDLCFVRKPTAEDGIIAMLIWSQLREAELVKEDGE